MKKIKNLTFLLLLMLSTMCWGGAFNEVEFLYGDGFKNPGDSQSIERGIMTWQHASNYGVFKQFAFIDVFIQNGRQNPKVTDPDAVGFYGEYYPSLSLTKLFDLDLNNFLVKSINLAGGINYGRNDGAGYPVTRVWLYGLSFDFNVPVGFLNVSAQVYDDYSYSSAGHANSFATYQITPAWKFPFEIFEHKLEFAGYIDFVGAKGPGKVPYIGTQIQIRYDVGHWFGHEGKALLGIEYHYFDNKFGIKGLTEHVPQAMLVWVF